MKITFKLKREQIIFPGFGRVHVVVIECLMSVSVMLSEEKEGVGAHTHTRAPRAPKNGTVLFTENINVHE